MFAAADVYSTIEDLPARWQQNAAWMAELSTVNAIDQFETANGAKLFPRVGDAAPVLLRKPLAEDSNLAAHSAIDPAATADNPILFVGDWRQYVVLDRIGMSVEFVPHLFNTTSNLPDGRRGWYAYWRVGGEPLSVAAFRVMNIVTAA